MPLLKRTVNGSPRWYVRITVGARQVWRSMHSATRPGAAEVARVEADLWSTFGERRRRPAAKASGPAAQAVEGFLSWAALNRSSSYHGLLKRSLDGLLEVAPRSLDKWTTATVEAWLRSGREGEFGRRWSARTQNMNRQHVSRFLRWAAARGLGADPSIMSAVERAAEKTPLPRWHSEEQVTAILAACEAWDAKRGEGWPLPGAVSLAGAVRLALGTGARLGELQAMRWEDVDTRQGTITIRPGKTGRGRVVPLASIALRALEAVPKGDRRGLILPWFRHKTDRRLRRALKKAGLRPCGWHSFRHTYASHLAMSGAGERQIMDLLGHTSIAMAARYTHLSGGSLAGVVARLDYREPVAPDCSSLT